MTDPIADRRQRARETYHDTLSKINTVTGMPAVEEAIEVATQVKITDDIEIAALSVIPEHEQFPHHYMQMIEAAFHAAGFEVVE